MITILKKNEIDNDFFELTMSLSLTCIRYIIIWNVHINAHLSHPKLFKKVNKKCHVFGGKFQKIQPTIQEFPERNNYIWEKLI